MDIKGTRTEKNLWAALNAESAARTKYNIWAMALRARGTGIPRPPVRRNRAERIRPRADVVCRAGHFNGSGSRFGAGLCRRTRGMDA